MISRVQSVGAIVLAITTTSFLIGCGDNSKPIPPAQNPSSLAKPESVTPPIVSTQPVQRLAWPLFPAIKNGEYGYINAKGEMIVAPQYTYASRFSDDLAKVKIGEKWGYLGKEGTIAIQPQFSRASDFHEGLASVAVSTSRGAWGVIDKSGRLVIPPKYDFVGGVGNGYAYVHQTVETSDNISGKGDAKLKMFYISQTGENVGSNHPHRNFRLRSSVVSTSYRKHKAQIELFSLVEKSGKVVLPASFQHMEFVEPDKFVAACKGGEPYLPEERWKTFRDFNLTFTINLHIRKYKCALYSTAGKQLTDFSFQKIGLFSDGLASIVTGAEISDYEVTGGQWGFIAPDGSFAINPQYDAVGDFSEQLAPVSVGGKWGYIDTSGKVVIPPSYSHAEGFKDGLALVNSLDWIDRKGSFIYRGSKAPDQAPAQTTPPSPNTSPKTSRSSGSSSPSATGTAFIVSKDGHAVTNHHVAVGCKTLRINGSEGDVKLITSDAVNDLALLQVAGTDKIEAAAIASEPGRLRQGEDVVVFGFPLNSVLSSGGNLTPGVVSALTGLGNNTNQIQITAPIQPGSSGSPVISRRGEVVGVVSMKLSDSKMAKATGSVGQNVNFAVNGSTLKSFLDANMVKYSTGGLMSFDKKTADLADEARKWTVLIECWK